MMNLMSIFETQAKPFSVRELNSRMNKAEVIRRIFPGSIPSKDFSVFEDSNNMQEIVEWNIDASIPTDEEFESVWKEILVDDFNLIKQEVIAEMQNVVTSVIYKGFTSATTTHTYSYEDHDQRNMADKMLELSLGLVTEATWKTEDAGELIHTESEFQSVFTEAQQHKEAKLNVYRLKKADIQNAETTDELEQIFDTFKSEVSM